MAKLVLQEDKDSKDCGQVLAAEVIDNKLTTGLQCGYWARDGNRIIITLFDDLDTIIHEIATRKAVRAELRAADKDRVGVEKPYDIVLDVNTGKLSKVYK